ncbi:MAG TPA: hypothetical protein VGG28_24135, partial [Kofleriaceae bacterium]
DGSLMSAATVRAMFQNLVNEWDTHRNTNAITAIMNEWDPFYEMEVGQAKINIAGHSHHHKFSYNQDYGMYLNLGSWCDDAAYFGKTWVDNDCNGNQILYGQLFSWDGNQAQPVTTEAGVPTQQ